MNQIQQKDKYSNNTTRPNIIVTTPNTEKPRLPSIKLIDKAKKKSPYSHGIFTNQFMRLKTDVNTTEKANNHVGIPNSKKFKSLRINDLFSTKMNKSHYNSTLVPYSSNIGNGNFPFRFPKSFIDFDFRFQFSGSFWIDCSIYRFICQVVK